MKIANYQSEILAIIAALIIGHFLIACASDYDNNISYF